jgi:hypothetical protein
MHSAEISIALVPSKTGEVTETHPSVTWDRLAERLAQVTVGEKEGTGWLPALMEKGPRSGERVQAITALVLDVEAKTRTDPETGIKTVIGPEPPAPGDLAAELDLLGWRFMLHTTHSHHDPEILPADVDHPRYRLVLALSRPLKPDEVKPLGHHVASVLGISDCFDKGAVEPARLSYLPRAPEARAGAFEFHRGDGEALDVDALLSEARRVEKALQAATKKRPAPRSGSVIEAFNQAHDTGQLLEQAGYIPRGRNRWMHPESTTRVPGVRLLPESDPPKVFSSHGCDPLNDGHAHDAFDCYRILLNDGNMTAAVREAAALLGMDLQHKPRAEVPEGDGSEECPLGEESPDLSHDQLALDLSRRAGWTHSARYVSGWGKWLFWDGARWQQDDKLHHMTEVRKFLRDAAAELLRWAARKSADTGNGQGRGPHALGEARGASPAAGLHPRQCRDDRTIQPRPRVRRGSVRRQPRRDRHPHRDGGPPHRGDPPRRSQ